jgi:hypothetical protein
VINSVFALVRTLATRVVSLAAARSPEGQFFGTSADVPPRTEWGTQP